ncbi:hypothetical protein [Lacipirellula sp.]|uniref:hypothetical protein n=1 Tax=Lacipirellula sp. TaxID=2691419 RepID=UPI003D0EE939
MNDDSSAKAIQTLRYMQIFACWGMLAGVGLSLIDHAWCVAAFSISAMMLVFSTIGISIFEWRKRNWRVSMRGLFLAMTFVAAILGVWAALGLFG